MSTGLATAVIALFGIYVAVGAVFALLFHVRGLTQLDRAAEHGSRGFRIVITPGVIALWPLLARRWLGTASQARDTHRTAIARGAGR
jgi:hypothetical protein